MVVKLRRSLLAGSAAFQSVELRRRIWCYTSIRQRAAQGLRVSDYQPPPLNENITDLVDLRAKVRERVGVACKKGEPILLFSDPPFVTQPPIMWALRCSLAVYLLGFAAVITVLFSLDWGVVVAALAILAWGAKWFLHLVYIAPARRRLGECQVLPAVVVQAFLGGFRPPEGNSNARPFTGVVVFSFDESVTIPQLRSQADMCLAAKTGTDVGPMADIRSLLLTGDTNFVHETCRLPDAIAGNDCTYVTPILFDRENDLADGHLSTKAQLILAHPQRPDHVCAVPLAFWNSQRSRELLDG